MLPISYGMVTYSVHFICSNFSDVFDEDHFINALANDVKVVKKLPKEMSGAAKAVKHFRSWSGMDYYHNEIASMWEEYQVKDVNICEVFSMVQILILIMMLSFSLRLFELLNLILV